jgi:hypothetical protein
LVDDHVILFSAEKPGSAEKDDSDRASRPEGDLAGNSILSSVITGTALNEKGEPLAGVTVSEKGKNNTVTTNENGEFKIRIGGNSGVLQFSSVGYSNRQPVFYNQTGL